MRRRALAWLSVAMLSVPVLAEEAGNSVDTRLEVYADRNDVISVAPVVAVKRLLSRLWSVNVEGELDAVTGASRQWGTDSKGGLDARSGASAKFDGVAGASMRSEGGEPMPEIRGGGKLSLTYSNQGRVGTVLVGGSNEHDYRSLQAGISGSWDFAERNTTLSGGVTVFIDNMSPPAPWNALGGGDKTVVSYRAGLSQILTPLTLAAVDLTLTTNDGYMGHPYNPVSTTDSGFIAERLPRSKQALAVSGQLVQGFHLGERLGSVSGEYRWTTDSWGLLSNTLDLKWNQHLTDETVVRLRGRIYDQGTASFVRDSYQGNEAYRTADIRLYAFRSWLLGIKVTSTFPEDWQKSAWLPDRWSLSYDHLWRNTRGNPQLYQLYSVGSMYMQGTGAVEVGWDL